jgi:DNA-directed RNA polymerase specialized sigma subunit
MNDVPNPVTKDTGTLGTMTSQDVKRLLSIKMPGRESEFKDWQQYNEQQYTVLLIVSATEEEKKEAMSNLLNANKPLFTKRARKEKLMNCGLDFEDIIQIEMLNFIEAINKAIEEGITSFPFEHAFDKYGSKRRIWEGYAPCGVKLSYSTKKRRVADNTYNMQRVTFVEEGTEAISAESRVEKENNRKCEMLDSELFGSVWKDELHSGLEAVIDGLSDFELGLLLGIVNKLSNVKIAENLGVSESTVRRYIPKMMAKAQAIAKNNGLDAYISDLYK